MIEVYETGIYAQHMVYATNDEKRMLDKLFYIKKPFATYYDTKNSGVVAGYHWLLHPITLKKHGLDQAIIKLPSE